MSVFSQTTINQPKGVARYTLRKAPRTCKLKPWCASTEQRFALKAIRLRRGPRKGPKWCVVAK